MTERRAIEAEREQALRQRDLLFRELNHRIKNNLQIVRAFLVLQSGQLAGPRGEGGADARPASGSRAVGELHALLYRGGAIGTLDLGAYLRELCQLAWRGHDRGGAGRVADRDPLRRRCRVDMDRAVLLGPDRLGAGHQQPEIRLPAARAAGQVAVDLRRGRRRPSSVLTVRTSGPASPAEPVEGFGLRIVRMLARQLNGALVAQRRGRGHGRSSRSASRP